MLAGGCCVTGSDRVEELDCSIRLYTLLKRNGFKRIEHVTANMTFFEIDCMGMKALRELLEQFDFLGFQLADWRRKQSADEYFSIYEAAEERRFAEEWRRLEKSGQNAGNGREYMPENAGRGNGQKRPTVDPWITKERGNAT